MKYPSIGKEIIQLKNEDLALRNKLLNQGQLDESYHPKMEALHKANTARLDSIINEIGYPSKDKVGTEANEAAWLIIQHAISNPAFMKKCLRLLEETIKEGETNQKQFAYLSDRIAVFEGRNQLYGTQFDWDEEGQLSPQAYDSIDAVNRRRIAIGLNLLEDQIQIIRKTAAAENHQAPTNLEERNRLMFTWKKSVGWLV